MQTPTYGSEPRKDCASLMHHNLITTPVHYSFSTSVFVKKITAYSGRNGLLKFWITTNSYGSVQKEVSFIALIIRIHKIHRGELYQTALKQVRKALMPLLHIWFSTMKEISG